MNGPKKTVSLEKQVENYERALRTMGMETRIEGDEFVVVISDLGKFKDWMNEAFRKAMSGINSGDILQ